MILGKECFINTTNKNNFFGETYFKGIVESIDDSFVKVKIDGGEFLNSWTFYVPLATVTFIQEVEK